MSGRARQERVLVTGGAGFVGSALVRGLQASGARVVVYDRLDPGRADFLPQGVELVVGDVCDDRAFRHVVETWRPDVIFHAAALHFIPDCDARPQETLRINVEGVEVVLRAAMDTAVPRVVFCSTAAVYAPFDGLSGEVTTPAGPIDIYGHSKYFAEQLIGWAQQSGRTNFVIARLFNVYGPRETNPHLIPAVLAQILRGQTKILLGNVTAQRDYVFVDDVARALHLLGEVAIESGRAEPVRVNICTGLRYSAEDVLDVLASITGAALSWEQDPTRLRASDRPVLAGDPTRLEALVGWAPATGLDTGLRTLLAWATAHPELMVG